MTQQVTTPLSLTSYDRLWWIAVAAINLGLAAGPETVLDALEQTPSHGDLARAAQALRHWRLDRSPRAVARLEALAPGCQVARCFLALVQLESGLIEAALAAATPLLTSGDEKAQHIARAIVAKTLATIPLAPRN